MIIGIGTDLVEIARIEEAMANPAFVKRILTPAEEQVCTTPERVAGRWAAKEALSKALPDLNNWHDVEILNDKDGRPVVTLADTVEIELGSRVIVSISHERSMASAVAIVEAL